MGDAKVLSDTRSWPRGGVSCKKEPGNTVNATEDLIVGISQGEDLIPRCGISLF